MSWRYVRWSFHNLHIPVLENEKGQLYCTSKALCAALGIKASTLRSTAKNHSHLLQGLSVHNLDAKEIVDQHRVEFGILRIRKDMRLWNEVDMVTIAQRSNSPAAIEFHFAVNQLIRDNARRDYVSRDEYERLLTVVEELRQLVMASQPGLQQSASAAGSALQAHKKIKHLRRVK
jgi:prophage antirepressor-like protein